MPYFIAPVGNEQQFNTSGAPLVGGKVYTYLAGSSTPAATYTDSTGATQQANPIILNSLGLSAGPIWMLGGVKLKFVFKDSADVTQRTVDNVSGVNDVAGQAVNEWVSSGLIPTYISGTSFSFSGDQTPTFQVDRRVRTTNTAGTVYGTITASVFSAGLTTITVLNDSGALDSGLSAVAYGIISVTNTSLPLNSSGLVTAINSTLLTPGPIGSTTPNTGTFSAINGPGLGITSVTTAAQFDNDTSPASTAFVQRALGNLAGDATYNTSTNIAAADVGKRIFVPSGTGSISLALPTTALPSGSQYRVYNATAASNVTLTTTGTITSGGSGALGSIVVGPGQTFDVTTDGVNNWVISQGDFANQARLSTGLNASGSAPMYVPRAWVNFNGTGTVAINGSGNVTSITDNGAGDYTLNFTTALPGTNYAVAISFADAQSGSSMARIRGTAAGGATLKSTTQLRISCGGYESATIDFAEVSVTVLR